MLSGAASYVDDTLPAIPGVATKRYVLAGCHLAALTTIRTVQIRIIAPRQCTAEGATIRRAIGLAAACKDR